jgi:hypothetical protein
VYVPTARVAVDTHGYTDVAMALAKLLGFDLCPRLYALRDRKLHVPRRFKVPAAIADLVVRDVSLEPIREAWDDLLRLTGTIEQGWLQGSVLGRRADGAWMGFARDRSESPIPRSRNFRNCSVQAHVEAALRNLLFASAAERLGSRKGVL